MLCENGGCVSSYAIFTSLVALIEIRLVLGCHRFQGDDGTRYKLME